MEPRKRWVALARPNAGRWFLEPPVPVGAVGTFLDRLRQEAAGCPVALGADFAVGLPRAYAATLPDADFPAFLRRVSAALPDFFQVAATLDEVAPGRPFYPARGTRGMSRAALAGALGLSGADALNRACDRATAERPAGAPLFWTLGANQTGKAAVAAWRDMLCPALARGEAVALWPFAGPFRALLAPGVVALAETYPAEASRHLGIRLTGSKRRQADRAGVAGPLLAAMRALDARPAPALAAAMADGFGATADGEDRFDCVIGVLGVLNVLAGRHPDAAPDDSWVKRWEGWVLGQVALPRPVPMVAHPATSRSRSGRRTAAAEQGGFG